MRPRGPRSVPPRAAAPSRRAQAPAQVRLGGRCRHLQCPRVAMPWLAPAGGQQWQSGHRQAASDVLEPDRASGHRALRQGERAVERRGSVDGLPARVGFPDQLGSRRRSFPSVSDRVKKWYANCQPGAYRGSGRSAPTTTGSGGRRPGFSRTCGRRPARRRRGQRHHQDCPRGPPRGRSRPPSPSWCPSRRRSARCARRRRAARSPCRRPGAASALPVSCGSLPSGSCSPAAGGRRSDRRIAVAGRRGSCRHSARAAA